MRPFIIGKGGANLKSLTSRTLTKIHIPRQQTDEESESQTISITGDAQGVSLAKSEILELVTQKVFFNLIYFNSHSCVYNRQAN